jgi:transaldolase
MKLFIDTANIDAIKRANAYGILSGVTTNPSIIAKEGRDFKETITEILSIVDGVVFGEVISLDAEKMVEEARELVKINKRLEIKVPMCAEGLKAINILHGEGIRTNCTLIFSAAQALLAARAGASYVSPFVGRLDDIAATGIDLIGDIAEIFAIHNIDCEIIAASTRSPLHVVQCAKLGAHIATVPPQVIEQMIGHPLTDIGIARFMKDWEGLLEKL